MSIAREKAVHVWERDPHDWYVEPPRVTSQLLTVERFAGTVWDPACGGGNIVTVLRNARIDAYGTDIVDRTSGAAWFQGTVDFLDGDLSWLPPVQSIITNPPFYRGAGAEAFIRKAVSIASQKVAAFVDVRFLAGSARAEGLFRDLPPHRVWLVTPRASCPPGAYLAGGGKAGNGSSDWCWMVWDNTAPFTTTSLGWLRLGAA